MGNYFGALIYSLLAGWQIGKGNLMTGCLFASCSILFLLLELGHALFPPQVFPEEISPLAKKKWEEAGCPHGRDEEFWLAAEHQIREEKKWNRFST